MLKSSAKVSIFIDLYKPFRQKKLSYCITVLYNAKFWPYFDHFCSFYWRDVKPKPEIIPWSRPQKSLFLASFSEAYNDSPHSDRNIGFHLGSLIKKEFLLDQESGLKEVAVNPNQIA
jgi:hypothetical protein